MRSPLIAVLLAAFCVTLTAAEPTRPAPLPAKLPNLAETVEPGESKPAPSQLKQATLKHRSTTQTAAIASGPALGPVETTQAVGPRLTYGDHLRAAYLKHICAPDGCTKPLGCGNFWTEKKFLFGSCRQFFGTAESTVGVHHHSRVP
jgi:hypothetical protein